MKRGVSGRINAHTTEILLGFEGKRPWHTFFCGDGCYSESVLFLFRLLASWNKNLFCFLGANCCPVWMKEHWFEGCFFVLFVLFLSGCRPRATWGGDLEWWVDCFCCQSPLVSLLPKCKWVRNVWLAALWTCADVFLFCCFYWTILLECGVGN